MSDLSGLDIKSLLSGYQKKEFRVTDVIASCLKTIESKNPKLNALLEVSKESALKRAESLEARMGESSKLKLFGVPIAIKDNLLVKGTQCTAGSKILEGYRSPYTATTVKQLEDAGAIVIGKANCDEFAIREIPTRHTVFNMDKSSLFLS